MASPIRLLAAATVLAAVLVAVVFAHEWWRLGSSTSVTADRIEREVRATVAERISDVEALSTRVAGEAELVANAADRPASVPLLFERLRQLAEPSDRHEIAVTIYAPGPGETYRVLAWSDGPGEKDLSPTRLSGPSSLFVAPGHAGLRLIRVDPIERGGERVAVAVAETVLAPVDRTSPTDQRRLATTYGPVTVIEQYVSARDAVSPGGGFVIESSAGAPLLDVVIDRDQLTVDRLGARRAWLGLAVLPIPLAVGLLAAWPLARRRAAGRAGRGSLPTALASAAVVAATLLAVLIGRFSGVSPEVARTVVALAVVGLVVLGPGHAWWRPVLPRVVARAPARFVADQLFGGVVLAAGLELSTRQIAAASEVTSVGWLSSAFFPFSAPGLLSLSATLLAELAIGWAAVSLLAMVTMRWHRSVTSSAAMIVLWAIPLAVLLASPWSRAASVVAPALGAAIPAGLFALSARALRRTYRRSTQSLRLALLFAAMIAPLVALYPVSATIGDALTRRLIVEQYAPETARHPRELRAELARAQHDIDAMPGLSTLIGDGVAAADNPSAFLVWSRTSLARTRVISDVELFNADGGLVSRFAFNLPEYLNRTASQTRQGSGCAWEVFGEVTAFGAEERLMLHAERGACDEHGRVLGGVIVHVASNDYQALPFVASTSAYAEVLGLPALTTSGPRIPNLAVAVYGWSPRPLFTAGEASWPVDPATIDRLYSSGAPFWSSLAAGGRRVAVYFSQDRAGIYALGYPTPTLTDHATRVAEIVALVAVLFVALQVGALGYAAVLGQRHAPLHDLLHEVRTSFYRKLFLAFVAAAVGPVLVAALAFGGYMSARFQSDVEREAVTTVTVARSVFQELMANADRDGSAAPNDDVMVWIRRVIDQDVNYFVGSELVATSQRDLFDSGLLPTRTPAPVYRGIVLERRPTLVADDRLGNLTYVVAAAPVPSRGAEAMLTVPLAPRQRELQRELDALSQRVLVGAVLVVVFAALLGAWLAGRVADPVSRLTQATRQIAAGRLDVRIATDSADELRTLVDDFNSMAATLGAQRTELARANQLKAWNEMARQVAHEIKNPLTPVQLAAEHLQQVHTDAGRPLGTVLDQCVSTILRQVRLLRQIASEFANFSGHPTSRPEATAPSALIASVLDPYQTGLTDRVRFDVRVPSDAPLIWADRTLIARALTNLVENAVQAMPSGGVITVSGRVVSDRFSLSIADTGVGMTPDALERAFEPYFSTKTAGSGLGLANARRNIERERGAVAIESAPGRGTTVTVTLPLAARPGGAAIGPTPSR